MTCTSICILLIPLIVECLLCIAVLSGLVTSLERIRERTHRRQQPTAIDAAPRYFYDQEKEIAPGAETSESNKRSK